MNEKIDNLDIRFRIIVIPESNYFQALQWDLIVKGKALKMIVEILHFLIQEDIDFIVKEYPLLVKEKKEGD